MIRMILRTWWENILPASWVTNICYDWEEFIDYLDGERKCPISCTLIEVAVVVVLSKFTLSMKSLHHCFKHVTLIKYRHLAKIWHGKCVILKKTHRLHSRKWMWNCQCQHPESHFTFTYIVFDQFWTKITCFQVNFWSNFVVSKYRCYFYFIRYKGFTFTSLSIVWEVKMRIGEEELRPMTLHVLNILWFLVEICQRFKRKIVWY